MITAICIVGTVLIGLILLMTYIISDALCELYSIGDKIDL